MRNMLWASSAYLHGAAASTLQAFKQKSTAAALGVTLVLAPIAGGCAGTPKGEPYKLAPVSAEEEREYAAAKAVTRLDFSRMEYRGPLPPYVAPREMRTNGLGKMQATRSTMRWRNSAKLRSAKRSSTACAAARRLQSK